jgi:hypothetical protein
LVRTKKLRKVKMQLSPESGNDRSTLPESGEHVWPDLAKIAGFRQDTSGPGQIRPDLGRTSGRIRSDQAGFRPVSVHAGFRRPAVFRWSDSDAGIIPET